jgi:hypothetical protein
MVTAPIVLLIAVASTPDAAATANEAAAACLHALPEGTRTVVRTVSAPPDEAEVTAAAAAAGATATVVVTWRDAQRLVSDVRVRAAAADGKPKLTERIIIFSARDLPAERGRALGLVIASILTDTWGGAPGAAPPPPQPASVAAAAVDAEVPPILAVAPRAPAPPLLRWGLDMSVISAVDAQEDFDDTIGGLIGFRRCFSPRWALRLGVGFRVADLDGAAATARTTLGSLGIVWSSSRFAEGRRLGFAARADLLGVHETIARTLANDDDTETLGHWTAGADLVGQVGLGLAAGTSLVLGAGLEGFLSGQSLATPGATPAIVPRGRIIFELGVLSRF